MCEKILVIDDEKDIANLLEVYLQNENYIVYKYYCAKDAIPCIEKGDIDLATCLLNNTDSLIWLSCSSNSLRGSDNATG